MKSLPTSHLRIARPSHDLRTSERFWVNGLGLDVLFRADSYAEGGHALLMVGWADAAWHLGLVSDPGGETPAAPPLGVRLTLCNRSCFRAERAVPSIWRRFDTSASLLMPHENGCYQPDLTIEAEAPACEVNSGCAWLAGSDVFGGIRRTGGLGLNHAPG